MGLESKILSMLISERDNYGISSMKSPYGAHDIPYQVGIRQGTYNGLDKAIALIGALLEDKAKKDDLL